MIQSLAQWVSWPAKRQGHAACVLSGPLLVINSTYGADASVLVQVSTESAQTTCMHCYNLLQSIRKPIAVKRAREQSGVYQDSVLWLARWLDLISSLGA